MHRIVVASFTFLALAVAAPIDACADAPATALKYHSVLVKRPNPGYLFDRFFNAWLDASSVDELEDFLLAQSKDPGRAADGLLLAFFYAKQGNDLEAIEQFRATLADNPGNAAAWYEKGVVEARTLDFETALADLEKASQADPDDQLAVRIAKLRGRLLVRTRRRDEALEVFRRLVEQRPEDDQLAEDVIEMQVDEGLLEEAARSARELIAKTRDPYRKIMRRLRLGDIRQRAGKRSEAIGIYSDVLEDVGAESWLEREVLSQIERAFRREDDVASLKTHYEELLERYPRRVGVRRGYARVLADMGESEKALEAFREILKITPGDRANQEAFIALHVSLEDDQGALEQLEALLQQHPDDPELYVQLAQLAVKTKAPERAAEAVDTYLAKSDKGEYAHLHAARLLERLELTDAAREKYAALTEGFPESPSAKESRASFLYKVGDEEEAIELWRASVAGGDKGQAVRVAKALGARQEHEAAYEVLREHAPDPADDGLYLAQLVKCALALEKYEEAIPLARRRVDLAATPAELDDALAPAATAIERGEKTPEVIRELQDNAATSQRKCLLAELHERTGDIQRADATLEPLVKAGDQLAVTQQIRLARQRRDWETAIGATRRLIDLPGGRQSRNVRELVELYERAYQLDNALEWIPEWKKLSPGSTSPWLTQARLLQIDGKNEPAIEALRAALREFDDASDVRARLASLYTQSGMLADAERIYWREYEESEGVAEKLRAVEQLARVAEERGKTDSLVDNFEERRRENRESIEPLMALATIHRVANNYEQRLQALGEAAKMRPDDAPLLKQIARVQEQEGDWELARDTLERAVAVDNTDGAKQQLARLHLRWGNPEQGYEILYELLQTDATDPRSIESIAEAMIGNDDWARAAEFLAPYVEKWPGDYRLRYLLGIAQEENLDVSLAADNFLAVMSADEELSGVTPPGQTGTSTYDQLAGIAPPGMRELIETAQLGRTVYTHRQQNRAYTTSYVAMGGGSQVRMPATVEEGRRYALMHLATLLPYVEQEQATSYREAAMRTGVPVAEIVLSAPLTNNSLRIEPATLLEEFPDNDAVLAYATLSGSGRRLDAEFYQRAFERFAEKWPQMALLCFTEGASQHEELHVHSNRAVRLLGEVEDPRSLIVMQLCSAPVQAQARRGVAGGVGLPEDFSGALSERLLEWYPKVRNSHPYGRYIFSYMARALSQGDDLKSFVRLLEDEVARSREDMRTGHTANTSYAQRDQNFLTPPRFPPRRLQQFPASVISVVVPPSGALHGFSFAGRQVANGWDRKAMEELLPTVEDPTLRMLLAFSAGVTNQVDEAVDALMANETPTLDDYLLAASWAVHVERPVKAIDLLEKARYLPMDRGLRRQVDAYLVSLVLDEKDAGGEANQDFSKDHVAAGREAALRLRHSFLLPEHRTLLADAMDEMGLEKEADRMAQLTTAVASSRSPISYSVATPSVQADRIQQLIDKGKQEAAARLLATDVLNTVRQHGGQSGSRSYNSYQFRQMRERVGKYALVRQVIKQLDPGESTSHRRIAEFAMALSALERFDEAENAYARAIELRPGEESYRVQFIAAQAARGKVEGAAEHFDHLGRNGAGMLALEIIGALGDNNRPLRQRLRLAGVGLDLLDHQKEKGSADLSWAVALLQALANRQYSSGSGPSLQTLYEFAGPEDADGSDAAKKRRELHDKLCRKMMEVDELAEDGFAGLLASHEAAGEIDDGFVELAREAISRTADHGPGVVDQYMRHVTRYVDNSRQLPLRTPGEFLVRHAWRSDDWSILDDQVLPMLEEQGRSSVVHDIEEYRKLYECKADAFPDAAKEYVRRSSSPATARRFQPGPVTKACEVLRARKLEVDVDPLLIDFMRDYVRAGQMSYAPPFVLTRLEQLVDQGDEDGAVAWLEKVTEVYIGPREKRAEAIAREFSGGAWSSNSLNGAMHMLGNLLEQSLARGELLLVTSRFIEEAGVAPIVDNAEYRYRTGLQQAMNINPKETDKAVAFLERAGLLAPLGGLRLPTGAAPNTFTLFDGVVDHLNNYGRNSAFKDAIDEALAAREEQTCATLMCRAIITKDEAVLARLMSRLGERLNTIETWDAPRQNALAQRLAAVVRNSGSDVAGLPAGDDSAGAAARWLAARLDDKNRKATEAILAARRYEDLQFDGNRVEEWLGALLPGVAASDPELAARIYMKVTSLYDDAMSRNAVNMYYSRSATAELLPRMVNDIDDRSPVRTRLLVTLVEGDGAEKLAFDHSDMRRFAAPLVNPFQELRNQARKEKAGSVGAAKLLYDHVQEVIGSRRSAVLAPAYVQAFSQMSAEELGPVEEWLDKKAVGGEDPLAVDMLAAARAARSAKTRDNHDGAKPTRVARGPHHEHYEAVLLDDEQSLATRVTLAEFLYDHEKQRAPLSTARAIARAGVAACKSEVPLDYAHVRAFAETALALSPDAAAGEYLDAWLARFLNKRPASTNNYPRSPNEAYDTTALLVMLRLCYDLERPEDGKKLVRRYDERIGHRHETLALLTEAGAIDEAATLARRNWRRLPLDSPEGGPARYSLALRENLPKLVEKLNDEPLGFIVEAALARLANGEQASEAELGTPDKRLTDLAHRCGDVAWRSDDERQQALAMLRTSDAALDLNREPLRKVVEKVNLRLLADGNSEVFETAAQLVIDDARLAAIDGDAGRSAEAFRMFLESGSQNEWRLLNYYRQKVNSVFDATTENFDKFDDDNLERLAEGYRLVLEKGSNYRPPNYYKANLICLVAHARAGQADAFLEWLKSGSLEPNARRMVKTAGGDAKQWTIATSHLETGDANTLEQRIKLVTDLIAMSEAAGWINRLSSGDLKLRARSRYEDFTPLNGVFTKYELPQAVAAVAEHQPLGGGTWAAGAAALEEASAHEEAADAWRRAAESLPDGDKRYAMEYTARRILALLDAGSAEAAQALVPSLEGLKDSAPNGQSRYDEVVETVREVSAPDNSDEKAPGDAPRSSDPGEATEGLDEKAEAA